MLEPPVRPQRWSSDVTNARFLLPASTVNLTSLHLSPACYFLACFGGFTLSASVILCNNLHTCVRMLPWLVPLLFLPIKPFHATGLYELQYTVPCRVGPCPSMMVSPSSLTRHQASGACGIPDVLHSWISVVLCWIEACPWPPSFNSV